jgi:hypothetical protein
MNVNWKKSTNESKGKPEQKFDAAFRTIVRISKQAKISYLFFSGTRQAINLKTISACTESTDLIVYALKKSIQFKISLRTIVKQSQEKIRYGISCRKVKLSVSLL